MDSPHREHPDDSRSKSDDRSISSQLITSKDVQQLTFTYFTEEDTYAPYGPFCSDCMNQLFRNGKFNAVSTVFVFRTLGFISFPTRTLVFMNGMSDPFSMKDIAEDFLVMPCFNCSQNNAGLNTIPVTDDDGVQTISKSSRRQRKRKLPSLPSTEKSSLERMHGEMDTSPNSKKKAEDVTIINNQIIDVLSTPTGIDNEVSNDVAKANSSSSIMNNESSVTKTSVIDQKGITSVDKSPLSTRQSIENILDALMMSLIDKLPTVHDAFINNNEEIVQNVHKETTSSRGISSDSVEILPVVSHVAMTDGPSRLPHGTAHGHNVLDPPKLPVSSTGSAQHKPYEGCVPEMSTSAGLQTGLSESSSFVGNKDVRQESSETQQLAKDKLPAILPPVDIQEVRMSNWVSETLKNIYGIHDLSREQLLDPRKDPRDTFSNGVYNPYSMAPFLKGRMNEVTFRLSFRELYDGMQFLRKYGGIKQYSEDFGIFMCQCFPEITEIKRCAHCGTSFGPDPYGKTYISHFLSYNHIVKSMNKGWSFSRYIDRLSSPKLAQSVSERRFTSRGIKFRSWESRLKK